MEAGRGSSRDSAEKRTRKILTAEGRLEVNLAFYSPGQSAPLHPHPHQDEVFYVLQGDGVITRGEERIKVSAGDIIYVPSGMLHDIQNTGTGEMITFFVKNTPPQN